MMGFFNSLGQPEFTVLPVCAGIGGEALGFQWARPEFRGVVGRFRILPGIDVDEEALADFEMLTGVPGVRLDLFTHDDYVAFHGHQPPPGWREARPQDIRDATGGVRPDVVFISGPCKGFSGLMGQERAQTPPYQALNNLSYHSLELIVEAFSDDLPPIILFENVPRIVDRGASLLAKIERLLGRLGYVFDRRYHDCGELGGLAEKRRRFLLIARLPDKCPGFVKQPETQRLKAIGEVLGPLPFPNDPSMGPLHRLPNLELMTAFRLNLIPEDGDWRKLQTIAPGDFTLVHVPLDTAELVSQGVRPDAVSLLKDGYYRVVRRGDGRVGQMPDPRLNCKCRNGVYGVQSWARPGRTVTGAYVDSGTAALADPRLNLGHNGHHNICRVTPWTRPAGTVTGATRPTNGALSFVDPRMNFLDTIQSVMDGRIPDSHANGPWVIIAEDGTWHRPATTLESAVLQGFPAFLSNGRPLTLAGRSDERHRERIGNAVPPPAAQAMGEEIGAALLNRDGHFELTWRTIWVVPEIPDVGVPITTQLVS